jgi:hypothetical protein
MLVHLLLTSRLLVLTSSRWLILASEIPPSARQLLLLGSPDVLPAGAGALLVASSVSLLLHTGHDGHSNGVSCEFSDRFPRVGLPNGSPFWAAVGYPVRSELLLVYPCALKWVFC